MLHPYPELACKGQVIQNYDFSTILPSGLFLYALDSGVVASGSGLNKGWQTVVDVHNPLNYYITATSWFVPRDTADNLLVFGTPFLPSNSCLSFRAWSLDSEYPEKLQIWIGAEGTSPDSTIYGTMIQEYPALSDSRNMYSIDLSAYSGQRIWIGFRHCSENKFIIGLDDIRLADSESLQADVIVAGLNKKPMVGDTMDIQAWVCNRGTDPYISGNVRWSVFNPNQEGSLAYTGPALGLNECYLFTFADAWIVPSPNPYTFHVELEVPGDAYTFTDTVEWALSTSTETGITSQFAWPVPADNLIRIQSLSSGYITDTEGRTVYYFSQAEIESPVQVDVSAWPVGMYFLHSSERPGLVQKLIIQHP